MCHKSPLPEVWYPALALRVDRRVTQDRGNLLSSSLLMATMIDLVPQPAKLETQELSDGTLVLRIMCLSRHQEDLEVEILSDRSAIYDLEAVKSALNP